MTTLRFPNDATARFVDTGGGEISGIEEETMETIAIIKMAQNAVTGVGYDDVSEHIPELCWAAVALDHQCRKELEEKAKIMSALVSMIQQYLPDRKEGEYSHEFMSAGEETLYLMADLGLMREVSPETFVFEKEALEKVLNGNPL